MDICNLKVGIKYVYSIDIQDKVFFIGELNMIFSVLAFIAVIVSICIKDRKKSLGIQSLNCIFEAIYDFLISAFTGAVLSIINFIRTSLFINKDKFSKKIYKFTR